MPDELEERLQKHARSFNGLLSLIPAKLYYGEDVSDQWKRKKQTPEQKREAKRQKLDPDNWKSAKDVMDERAAEAKKRKREEDGDISDLEDIDLEKPKAEENDEIPKPKKQKPNPPTTQSQQEETEEERIQRKREARMAKRERKKEQKLKAREKIERAKARKQAEKAGQPATASKSTEASKPQKQKQKKSTPASVEEDAEDQEDDEMAEEVDIHHAANPLSTQLDDDMSTSDTSVLDQPEVFSPPQESGTSSISSIHATTEDAPKPQNLPTADANAAPPRERLANAIAAFRTQRKADGEAAPKSRAELLEQRRRQEERRRAEKKEQKRREKEEAQRQQEAEIAARFSPGGSGSLLNSPRSPISAPDTNEPNNFSFGRIAFDDGSSFNPNASYGGEEDSPEHAKKKKGPSDAATALSAAMKKKSRLSGLDEEKQSRIASQDMWLAARKRAAGEKVKDDTSLLKKALKRQEGQKKKSEKEWTERKEGIDKSIAAKQKKRTENLAKRKEEKGSGGKKSKGKPKRPGFEGSFKGRTGGKKNGKA